MTTPDLAAMLSMLVLALLHLVEGEPVEELLYLYSTRVPAAQVWALVWVWAQRLLLLCGQRVHMLCDVQRGCCPYWPKVLLFWWHFSKKFVFSF